MSSFKYPSYNSRRGSRRPYYNRTNKTAPRTNFYGSRVVGLTTNRSARNSAIFSFRRSTGFIGKVAFNGVTETKLAYSFKLNDLPGYTEFTGMYDFYRITKVKVTYLPEQTDFISTGNVNSSDHIPLITVVDNNDASVPASVDELREYQDHKVRSIIRPFKETFQVAFQDATSSERDGWIATTNATQPYFGFKVAAPPTAATTTAFSAWFECTYYVEFKQPK